MRGRVAFPKVAVGIALNAAIALGHRQPLFSQTTVLTIGFDADDTLWQNETVFRLTQERFASLLVDFAEPDHLVERLMAAEERNLRHYGFGIKGFILSMIETAIEVTEQRVPASVIAQLVDAGREMLAHPIDLIEHAEDAVRALSESHRLLLITKGDLLDQERKLAQSGLGDACDGVHIVSDKTPAIYRDAFAETGRAMLNGKSMRTDVLPALEAGAWGVYVPHGLTWSYEQAPPPTDQPRYRELTSLAGLVDLVAAIES